MVKDIPFAAPYDEPPKKSGVRLDADRVKAATEHIYEFVRKDGEGIGAEIAVKVMRLVPGITPAEVAQAFHGLGGRMEAVPLDSRQVVKRNNAGPYDYLYLHGQAFRVSIGDIMEGKRRKDL